jgi:hypothetical protein
MGIGLVRLHRLFPLIFLSLLVVAAVVMAQEVAVAVLVDTVNLRRSL